MALHNAIKSMLEKYKAETQSEYKNALKEISQEVALLGLSRSRFFDKASFYGGTALRIVHGLDRFSEDLDFELNESDPDFDLQPYLDGINDEFKTYNLRLHAEKKQKFKSASSVESAFIKGNTVEHLLLIENLENPAQGHNRNDLIKIKLEIDVDPPEPSSAREVRYHQDPISFAIRILDLPSLQSGKLHAVLCRNWKGGRVKGRDFYDYLWYRKKGITPNLEYLKAKLVQSNHWSKSDDLTIDAVNRLLMEKFGQVDWEQAKSDVAPFIKDSFALEVWSEDFFSQQIFDVEGS